MCGANGTPAAVVVLTEQERETVVRWSRRAKSSQVLEQRFKIVLRCVDGLSNKEIAADLQVHPVTVTKWRGRFVQRRLDRLVDEPRPGRPAAITRDQIEQVVVATLEQAPQSATHWSRASIVSRSASRV